MAENSIRFTFRGTITSVSGVATPPPEVVVGASYEASYVFRDDAPDLDPSFNFGLYDIVLGTPTVSIAGFSAPGGEGTVSVLDNGFAGDTYQAAWGNSLVQVQVGLSDFQRFVFSSDDLPLDIDITRFNLRTLNLQFPVGDDNWQVAGTVDVFESQVLQQCNPDYNMDGGADNSDIFDLASDIAAGTQSFPPANPDFNNDGGADNTDVFDLANTIASGLCPS